MMMMMMIFSVGHVVISSYTTVPVAFRLPLMCIVTNLEVQERRSLAYQGTLTTAAFIM